MLNCRVLLYFWRINVTVYLFCWHFFSLLTKNTMRHTKTSITIKPWCQRHVWIIYLVFVLFYLFVFCCIYTPLDYKFSNLCTDERDNNPQPSEICFDHRLRIAKVTVCPLTYVGHRSGGFDRKSMLLPATKTAKLEPHDRHIALRPSRP